MSKRTTSIYLAPALLARVAEIRYTQARDRERA